MNIRDYKTDHPGGSEKDKMNATGGSPRARKDKKYKQESLLGAAEGDDLIGVSKVHKIGHGLYGFMFLTPGAAFGCIYLWFAGPSGFTVLYACFCCVFRMVPRDSSHSKIL